MPNSPGARVIVSLNDPSWVDADYTERDEHRASLLREYVQTFGPSKRTVLAAALWIKDEGPFDRALKLAMHRGWIMKTAKGIYSPPRMKGGAGMEEIVGP